MGSGSSVLDSRSLVESIAQRQWGLRCEVYCADTVIVKMRCCWQKLAGVGVDLFKRSYEGLCVKL